MAIYYVKNGGNDSADGLNDANAWETINKVNNSSFSPGDIICFKKGDLWREMLIPVGGTSAGRITYTSYGEGDKPAIYGSIASLGTGDWTDLGSNIWQHTATFSTYEVSNLIFNNGTSNGVRIKPGDGSPDAQGEFYFNTTTDRLTIYSVGNPHTFYNLGIEIALGRNAIHAWYADYIVIDGLSIKFTGRHGIGMVENDYVTVQNCDFFYMGGMEDYDGAGYRLGNGVEFWNHCTNILVQYNTFDQIFDAGVSPQHDCEYISIRYNIFSRCCWALEISTRTVNPLTTSFHFNNNTLVKTGGYSMNQRWGVGDYACPIIVWTLYGTGTTDFSGITDIQIRNNIICEVENTLTPFGMLVWYANTTVHPEYNQDYNIFYQTLPWGNSEFGCIGNGASYYFNLHGIPNEIPEQMYDWSYNTGLDIHSTFANPLFVDYEGGDYHLAEGSPAVGAGYDLNYTRDFDGNIVSNSPSIGAYEYGSEPEEDILIENIIIHNWSII